MKTVNELVQLIPLQWREDEEFASATCYLTGYYSIWYEEHLWWPAWDVSLPGHEKLEDAKAEVEKLRNSRIFSQLQIKE